MTHEETRRMQIDNFKATVESIYKAILVPGGYSLYWRDMFMKDCAGQKPTSKNVKHYIAHRLYENQKNQWWFKEDMK